MENKTDESEERREMVTLILETEQFQVEKQKLINKSQYFAALLSANYIECCQTKHIINYNISAISLQAFIDWIHYDKLDVSVTSFDFREFDHLLILLELGVLFAADNLIEDIAHRLERHYMSPKYIINIWLLAQELNLKTLQDLSLAACLDRFNELPLDLIYGLPKEDFLKLIGNINIRSSKSYVSNIIHEWTNRNHDTVPKEVLKERQLSILYSVISCESTDVINNEVFIHCWDGNDFFELTSFKYPKDITNLSTGKNMLAGMQIAARGYDLYLCGGEFGIGSGKFNKNIWRYSLISKKWILQTIMPIERRHMVAVCLKNKLVLVGGVGRYRQKLQSVDIYDIHTDAWTSGADFPSNFTSVPEHYVFKERLVMEQGDYIYCYCSDWNGWTRVSSWDYGRVLFLECLRAVQTPILPLKSLSCYIDTTTSDKMVLRTITETCNIKNCSHSNSCCVEMRSMNMSYKTKKHLRVDRIHPLAQRLPDNPYTYLYIIPYFHFDTTIRVHMDYDYNIDNLYLHSIPIRNPNKFRSFLVPCHTRFFNLLNPAHLHMTLFDDII